MKNFLLTLIVAIISFIIIPKGFTVIKSEKMALGFNLNVEKDTPILIRTYNEKNIKKDLKLKVKPNIKGEDIYVDLGNYNLKRFHIYIYGPSQEVTLKNIYLKYGNKKER